MNKIIFTLITLLAFNFSVQAMETEELIRQTIDKNNLPKIQQNINKKRERRRRSKSTISCKKRC